jgi:nucleoside-diphosphate-sugar epimerase
MKILVTGADGYIGRNICEYMSKLGHTIVEMTRRKREGVIHHDIRYPLFIDEAFDAIVHLAGNSSAKSCIHDTESSVYDNIIGTYNILEFARRIGVKKFIYFSTCEVYNGNLDAKETDLPVCTNMYAASKLSGEHMCEAYFKSYGFMDTCIVMRLIHSYGKHCQPDRFASIVQRRFQEETCPHFILRTREPKRWISVEDVCNKTEFCLCNSSGFSTLNLVGSENLTLEQFIRKFGDNFTFEYDTSLIMGGYYNEVNANGDKLDSIMFP